MVPDVYFFSGAWPLTAVMKISVNSLVLPSTVSAVVTWSQSASARSNFSASQFTFDEARQIIVTRFGFSFFYAEESSDEVVRTEIVPECAGTHHSVLSVGYHYIKQ